MLNVFNSLLKKKTNKQTNQGKSILQVPDTGTRVLDNSRPFLCSSIVSFWITPAGSKERKYHIIRQCWYTRNVPVFTITGTFQYFFFQNKKKQTNKQKNLHQHHPSKFARLVQYSHMYIFVIFQERWKTQERHIVVSWRTRKIHVHIKHFVSLIL